MKETNDIDTSSITDIEGNTYKVVKIREQWWMAENLVATKLNDETSILNAIDDSIWSNISLPAYCWYSNEISYKDTFGALYNWTAIITGKLCPTGWHVPTNEDWRELYAYYSMGKNLKGTSGWRDGGNGNDQYQFAALPGGYRTKDGTFGGLGYYGFWWSSSLHFDNYYYINLPWYRIMYYNSDHVQGIYSEVYKYGMSVRCIKDADSIN